MEKILKQLKKITPDREYSLHSRISILSLAPGMKRPSVWQVLVNSFQFSTAVALASLLFILVLGGFSTLKFLSPFHPAGVEIGSIRAEAEAVDAQLQLTGITYVAQAAENGELTDEAKERAADMGIPASSSETTIDDVLDILSE
jgi:hypothetical protein